MSTIKYFIILFSMIVISCNTPPLSGHIEMEGSNFKHTVYLLEINSFDALLSSYYGELIDSVEIDKKGFFAFANIPNSEDKAIYMLTLQKPDSRFFNKLIIDHSESENYLPFVYQKNSRIRINSRANAFLTNATITSDLDDNNEISQLRDTRVALHEKYLRKLEKTTEDNLMTNEKALYNYQVDLIESVAQQQSIYTQALALRWASPEKDYERIPEMVKRVCTTMKEIDAHHPWTEEVCRNIYNLPLSIKDVFPDFPLPMSDKDTVQLYSLLGAEMTILDLWASWCAPCRIENRNILVPLWEKYHDMGVQIIGYALDDGYDVWHKAIQKDGAYRWPQASHLNGDNSPLLDKIKVNTIPANYILDKNGVILAKNLHGEELNKIVARLLEN